jgi:hypothetical protein
MFYGDFPGAIYSSSAGYLALTSVARKELPPSLRSYNRDETRPPQTNSVYLAKPANARVISVLGDPRIMDKLELNF